MGHSVAEELPQKSLNMAKYMAMLSFCLFSCLIAVEAGRVQYPSPYIYPSQQNFGASAPPPCCRSNFPEEYGSCLTNEHCPQPTAPYCSAFGYCTQIQIYGHNGCTPCAGYAPQTLV